MADTHEADRSGLTAGHAVRDLFAQVPAPGNDVVWLADQLLGVAQHLGSVGLERVRDGEGRALVCRTDSAQLAIPGRDALRLFRPLLARFAVLGAEETGGEPQLYGGSYALVRSSPTGPVRLEVAFANTPEHQHITISRVSTAAPRPSNSPPDAAPASTPIQPSA
jgi:hypothetical protein